MQSFDVLIVGGGHAGAQTAIALRQLKFEGSIAIVGRETVPPYERPPLSKDYLAGDKPFARMLIRPQAFWAEREVALLLGREVVAIDPAGHAAICEGGERIGYGKLVWAGGGEPRRLPCAGHHLAGVHSVRNLPDVDAMRTELASVSSVVVIGGGYIGLEAAAVLTKLGKQVTLLEAADRLLSRVAGEKLSRFYEAEHRARGVNIRLGVEVVCIEDRDGRVAGVRLASGDVLPAELVIVGIGIEPAVQPLHAAGATGQSGVDIDEHCRTSLADIYAVGDCAAHCNAYAGGARIRLESVQNANDQASTAARHIVGQPQPYDALPWFWSNQYDLKLQTVGLSIGHDDALLRGEPNSRSFSLVYLKQDTVIALDCVNAVKDYVQGRALIGAGAPVERDRLADIGTPLKELLG